MAAVFRFFSKVFLHPWFRFSRGLTLGVRALVVDDEGKILLVRHSYMPGWYLPGGGVERGETAGAALVRELHEEAGVKVTGDVVLAGIYSNHDHFAGDHVVLYKVTGFTRGDWTPTAEIREARFFDAAQLPDGTSAATARRIAGVVTGGDRYGSDDGLW